MSYEPEIGQEIYAIRAMQWTNINGEEVLLGGQTFVHGNVKGFENEGAMLNQDQPSPNDASLPFWKKIPWWLWLFLLPLVLAIVFFAKRKKR